MASDEEIGIPPEIADLLLESASRSPEQVARFRQLEIRNWPSTMRPRIRSETCGYPVAITRWMYARSARDASGVRNGWTVVKIVLPLGDSTSVTAYQCPWLLTTRRENS